MPLLDIGPDSARASVEESEGRPAHGGRLIAASRTYDIPLERWLDLSTGISPVSWPVPGVPERVWRDLPQEDDGLVQQASAYYDCLPENLLPVPGSQFAIEALPLLFADQLPQKQKVALPYWGYQEHHYHWRGAGYLPVAYRNSKELMDLVEYTDVSSAVVINPNNPSTETMVTSGLLSVAARLSRKGGLLVVDEAFMDATPAQSLCAAVTGSWPSGLVVLRSVGKFFGLAGMRLGFVVAERSVLAWLNNRLSPWAVSHPARWVGAQVLADQEWQTAQRFRLRAASADHLCMLKTYLPQLDWAGAALFASGFGAYDECARITSVLARQGILVRELSPSLFGEVSSGGQAGIRIGLPAESDQQRLLQALQLFSSGMDVSGNVEK